jgi:hypothetical protein
MVRTPCGPVVPTRWLWLNPTRGPPGSTRPRCAILVILPVPVWREDSRGEAGFAEGIEPGVGRLAFPPASPRRGAPVIGDRRNSRRAAELDCGLPSIPVGLALAGCDEPPIAVRSVALAELDAAGHVSGCE